MRDNSGCGGKKDLCCTEGVGHVSQVYLDSKTDRRCLIIGQVS